jgi:hypothetical protein
MMTLHLVCGIDAADTDEADEAECRAHSLTSHFTLAHHSIGTPFHVGEGLGGAV